MSAVPENNQGSPPESQRASSPAAGPPEIEFPHFHSASFDLYRRRLPHFRAAHATYFVTWRLLQSQRILAPAERELVARALLHFNDTRYNLLAWVVMDDHVHALVYPAPGRTLSRILHSWKSFTANRMRQDPADPRTGRVWLDESFDRIVRDARELFQKLYYILNNPFRRWPTIAQYAWVGVHPALADIGPVGTPVITPTEYRQDDLKSEP